MTHRAVIVGAGRIGAGFNWHDMDYTHAGAYRNARSVADAELVGVVEPNAERREWAESHWNVPGFAVLASALSELEPDMVSVCVGPDDQRSVFLELEKYDRLRGMWCEKPWGRVALPVPVQVNYIRRADPFHRKVAEAIVSATDRHLFVIGKTDIHTRCHFEDLAAWWQSELHVLPFNGPCSYVSRATLANGNTVEKLYSLGGVDGGLCMRRMLLNLVDAMDNGKDRLWSPMQ